MEFCHLGSDLKTKKDSQRRVQSVNKKKPPVAQSNVLLYSKHHIRVLNVSEIQSSQG